MTFNQLSAIVRMRWQIARNQFRKSGVANQIASAALVSIALLASLSTFLVALVWGRFLLAQIEPSWMVYVWDAIVGMFLFAWAVTLMVELQRSEIMSLKNLLHLPVSLSGAFLLNYAGSLASLTILLFLPPVLGLCVASVLSFGARSLIVFGLVAAFMLMVTAVSYQLRGWLARLMENKRTRGTVITVTTIVFVLIFQIPNLINMGRLGTSISDDQDLWTKRNAKDDELKRKLDAGEIERAQYAESIETNHEQFEAKRQALRDAKSAALHRATQILNLALPIGWLPYGAGAAAGGSLVSPWLCMLGMSLIGFASLTLAYRSTLRVYTGHHTRLSRPAAHRRPKSLGRSEMLEKSVPFLSDRQSAVTMATLRSTLRAPEAKMALLTPLIFACVFGSTLLTGQMDQLPNVARPWLGIAALGMSVVSMVQMMLNMFGLDRQGFRAYVLMPAPRRDILLGKNLGLLPLAATLSGGLILFVGLVCRMQYAHIVATMLQIGVAFLLYCVVSNYTSIVAPIGMAAGTMKPVSMKFSVVMIQLVALVLVPVAILPAALALGAELIVDAWTGIKGVPIYLLMTLLQLPLAIWFYNRMLDIQGRHLQQREQAILEAISQVTE